MKHIKPGRGPSAMGAAGSLIAAVFGVFWTIGAASIGAPVFFCLFGVLFVILGIVQAVYSFKNATGKNRYSAFDIVDSAEEPDPWDQRFGETPEPPADRAQPGDGVRYCPYCGAEADEGFAFCAKCGRKLPDLP